MKVKKLIVMIIVALLIISFGNSYAVVQSTKATHNSPTTTNWASWMTNMRTVESSTGAMGLSETYNTSTLEPTTEENGVDVHMMKNTEYGAVGLLAASAYGTEEKSNPKPETTTGNNTGVYMNYSTYQYTAGVRSGSSGSYKARYIDSYGNVKVGDATSEISNWNTWRKTTSLLRNVTLNCTIRQSVYTATGSGAYSTTYFLRGYNALADCITVGASSTTINTYFSSGGHAFWIGGTVNYWQSIASTSFSATSANHSVAITVYNGTPNYMGRGVAVFL